MNGRDENELKIEQSINRLLKEMPAFVTEWQMNMKASDKTAASREDYLHKVSHFLSYISRDPKHMKATDITRQNVTSYYVNCKTKLKNGELIPTSDSYQIAIGIA